MSEDNGAPYSRREKNPSKPPQGPKGGTTRLSSLQEWLGLQRNILVMLFAVWVLGMGEELWIRFVPKYLEILGATIGIIAIYGTLQTLLDAIYQYPGGWLADKLGRRRALILFIVLAIVGYISYFFAASWEWILLGTFFVLAWDSLAQPAIFAIVGDNLPSTRRAIGFAMQSILKRVPIVLAPPLGGWFIASLGFAVGMKLGLGITIVLALGAIFFVQRYYKVTMPSLPEKGNFIDIWRTMDIRLKRLLLADCFVRWAEGIPAVFAVLYVINILGLNTFQFGLLTSIQMFTAIVPYIPVAKLADRMNRKPFILLSFIFFSLFPLILVTAAGLVGVVVAFIVAGLREIGEPPRKALIVDLASESARGRAVGIYYLLRGLALFPASLVGGWLWMIDPTLPFYVAFLVGTIGCLIYLVWGTGEHPSHNNVPQGG